MKRQVSLLSVLLLTLLVLTGPGVRADYYYNFSPIDFPTVYSDNSGMGISISNQPQVGPISTGLDTNVVAATMTTFINPGVTGTDTFNNGQHSTIALTIVDGNANGTVEFGLKFSGSLASNNSSIKVEFDGPSTRSLVVNNNKYTIKLDSIVPPGIPTAIPGSVGGRILAGILVEPPPGDGGGDDGGNGGGDDGNPNNVPEPSTLVLSCLGLSLLGLKGWRKLVRK